MMAYTGESGVTYNSILGSVTVPLNYYILFDTTRDDASSFISGTDLEFEYEDSPTNTLISGFTTLTTGIYAMTYSVSANTTKVGIALTVDPHFEIVASGGPPTPPAGVDIVFPLGYRFTAGMMGETVADKYAFSMGGSFYGAGSGSDQITTMTFLIGVTTAPQTFRISNVTRLTGSTDVTISTSEEKEFPDDGAGVEENAVTSSFIVRKVRDVVALEGDYSDLALEGGPRMMDEEPQIEFSFSSWALECSGLGSQIDPH